MIACYAWSNLMILNAMNIKLNYYPDEEMDIFIRMTPGISREIISVLKRKNIFANIYYTSVPTIQINGRFQKLLKIRWISYYKKYQDQYNRMLFNLVGDKKYDIVMTAGFWNDSLYYIDFFAQNNSKLNVVLYDEGGASYDNPKKNLTKYYCNKNITSFKNRLKRFFVEKRLESKHKGRVQNSIYLYSPERYKKIDSKVDVAKIPIINESNEVMNSFFRKDMRAIFEEALMPYVKRNIYFITMGNTAWMPDCEEQSLVLIEKLMENVNNYNLIIKTHPNNTKNREGFAEEYEAKTFVDRGNALLECIYSNVDIEDKLIITYASSSAMYVKTMFDKEPYVILVFRLYHQYHEHGDENAERYAQDMKELFRDKSKVYIPNTIDEYIENIREVKRKLIKY